MSNNSTVHGVYFKNRICPALKRAKITNPESQAGIDFCTESCPYPECIVFEGNTLYKIEITREKTKAKKLQKKGMTAEEIAAVLGKSIRTVEKYLK